MHSMSGRINFERVPVLAEHISIPPHDVVKDAKHSYSFSERGTDLCFHSPTSLPEGAGTLATFLAAVASDFLRDEHNVRLDTANAELEELTGAGDSEGRILDEIPEFSPGDPIGNWFVWGEALRAEHEIEQYAFVKWHE